MSSPVRKITAVLPAAAIEPCIAFWERLGFATTVSVPHGNALGFAILSNGSVELMYQSFASIAEDVPAVAELAQQGPTLLFVEVDDIDAAERATAGAARLFDRRTTFYGATEIGVRDPAGHCITLAQFPAGE